MDARSLPVSLIIPAFNAERTIARTIASVLDQPCVPGELLVIDDASSDGTAAAAARAGARVVRLARNGGPSIARNLGVAAAEHAWIAFLDADDLWHDGKLAAQWAALERWPDAGFCFTDYDVTTTLGTTRSCETAADPGYRRLVPIARAGEAVRFSGASIVAGLIDSMFIRQSSVIVKRSAFERSGGYDTRLRLAEDHDFFLRLAARGDAIAIERAFVTYVRGAQTLSSDPLAEIAAIDGLWNAVLANPARYAPLAAELIRARRHRTLEHGARLACRLGRFREAVPLARRAFTHHRSAYALGLVALAAGLDTPPGRAAFGIARQTWRARKTLRAALQRRPATP
jgi:glycosyltransferase involved in cell wall biosynthesis